MRNGWGRIENTSTASPPFSVSDFQVLRFSFSAFQHLFSMSDVIISVENLGKKYRIQHQAEGRRDVALRDVIAEKAKGFFKKLKLKESKAEKLKSGNISAFQPVSVSDFKNVSASQRFRFFVECQPFRISACQSFIFRGLLGLARHFLRGQTRGGGGHHWLAP